MQSEQQVKEGNLRLPNWILIDLSQHLKAPPGSPSLLKWRSLSSSIESGFLLPNPHQRSSPDHIVISPGLPRWVSNLTIPTLVPYVQEKRNSRPYLTASPDSSWYDLWTCVKCPLQIQMIPILWALQLESYCPDVTEKCNCLSLFPWGKGDSERPIQLRVFWAWITALSVLPENGLLVYITEKNSRKDWWAKHTEDLL